MASLSDMERKLFDWYQALRPLRVDLIGDFAGKELFAIHGEALLTHCISEAKLNYQCYEEAKGCVESPEFQLYTAKNSLRFFLCLDGFVFDERKSPFAKSHLAFINQLSCRGYSVALINNFEFKSSKAFTSMLPPSQRAEKVDVAEPLSLAKLSIIPIVELKAKAGIVDDWSPWGDRTPLSARDMVSLTGVCNALLRNSAESMRRCVAAYIIHLSELKRCNLSNRACDVAVLSHEKQERLDAFFACFTDICATVIECLPAQEDWTIVDLLDSRIIRQVLKDLYFLKPSAVVVGEAKRFAERIQLLTGINISDFLPQASSYELPLAAKDSDLSEEAISSVMTFQHPALDKYLEPIHVVANDTDEPAGTSKVFRELSHWHNAKKAVDPKAIPRPAGFFRRRRNQELMADTIKYAASLTNSAGNMINPETIVTSLSVDINPTKQKDKTKFAEGSNSKAFRHSSLPKNKNSTQKGGRESALEEARRSQRQKLDSKARDVMAFWDERCREFQAETNTMRRLAKITTFLEGLSDDARDLIGAEINLYLCHTLISMIPVGRQRRDQKFEVVLFARVWSAMLAAAKLAQSIESLGHLAKLSSMLKMPVEAAVADNHLLKGRRLPFSNSLNSELKLPIGPLEFQLGHCGPFLERSFDPAPDIRVPNFVPDAWQREVLDVIDAEKSLFVVAPTSAGKTFISFYAMKQVLQSSDDGVLVYVAPTKALVNQIAAEVQARFSKLYKHDGRSVWAIHTRDHRINNPTGCQILVTVPHILQIMLLAPSNAENAKSWSARVKRIIFDEIHCIGQADDGVIWEQLLLLAPCPIIALSATVGNPLEFMQWLEASEKVKGREIEMIVHTSRYSDLRKFLYRAPENDFVFRGLLPVESLATPGLDEGQTEEQSFGFIHPILSLRNRNRGTIEDVTLEPRDCLSLWRCMSRHQNEDYPIDDKLRPERSLPTIVKRSDVLKWGESLKKVLHEWIQDANSPFSTVQNELGSCLSSSDVRGPSSLSASDQGDFRIKFSVSNEKHRLVTMALPLLTDLHTRGALPGILFSYDRDFCEATAKFLLAQLERAETAWKKCSPEWAKKVADYKAWKKTKSRIQENKTEGKKRPGKSRGQDDEEMSKIDMMREASVETSKWESFDPEAPLDRFSFAEGKKISNSELKPLIERLIKANIQPELIAALGRGIAVHHAGMNRNYRQIVEMLFRKGYLRVVIATGTLALGINMPCKTVVFFGDSVFLTPLNYHQASGRAGRRGFDLLGNVVFVGMPLERALEIMSSKLPDLSGHFPLSTTLVVRLLGLLHHTKNSEYATKSIKSILSLSRLYLGGPSDQMAIQHHLRFSIEYLRRQQLLSRDGTPLNFAGLIGHLYFTENAVFAFHSLLKDGYFHRVCKAIDCSSETVLLELVLVLSHLFCRLPLGVHANLVKDIRSPSVITLPALPTEAETILRGHNQETLDIFRLYVSTFIRQHLEHTPDTKLPFTGIEVKAQQKLEQEWQPIVAHLPPTKLRSPFAALSGFTDKFDTIHELCATVRSGVFLEESAVPYIRIYPADTGGKPWNAYIYDFFKHGDLKALVRDNHIKRGDVWFHLKDFSLILATIVTSLENFVRLDIHTDDAAMMDVQDAGDVMLERCDEMVDEDKALSNGAEKGSSARAAAKQRTSAVASKKKVELDSWEDDVSNDDSAPESPTELPLDGDSWQDQGDGNLLQVLKAFRMLQEEFETKFRKEWA
ncbi:putative helicase [Beauveria bassiana D1-5]|uniref:Putative helicase n=1 Tax=Beauveria bassiana D1-5 TaxID=1245745 RepID=A0A0A2W7Q6_BEABA|nr:putative helicase [Beauveria bassiana D1-5]